MHTYKPATAVLGEETRRTWNSRYVTVTDDGFFSRKFSVPIFEVDHTDGIGTKGRFHWECRTFRNAVLDALAMNLNDLLMHRATPYKTQNHVFMPTEDLDAAKQIGVALADECQRREICITGGECAIHDGLEISITMSGFAVARPPNTWEAGDVLVGLASSGFHSNGFTYLRRMMSEHGSAYVPFRDEWLTPTRIYHLPNWPLYIKGIQHITGGGFAKLKNKIKDVDLIIHRRHGLRPQDTFHEVYRCQWSDETMYRTFNCGIGMVLSVAADAVNEVINNVGGEVIGEVRPGQGAVVIESMFSNLTFTL